MEPLNRRGFMRFAGLAGATWLSPIGSLLARSAEADPDRGRPAQSIIVLWLGGGPSQLETFDPHPGSMIAGGTGAISTAVKGIQLAPGLERTAEEMGSYNLKTGFRPDPTVIHPTIGAVVCHELPVAGADIPRYVSILPGQWPSRGGYLGEQFDPFHIDDPAGPVPDTKSTVSPERDRQRMGHLDVVESAFARGRERRAAATLHRPTMDQARKMMSSEQLKAFDVSGEPIALQRAYGETPFGRGCLAARRLIEVGVRCVEVTLDGWDTHANNHGFCQRLLKILDPAFGTLVHDLRTRGLLERTLVLCMGEFGRTPAMNPAGGRDHWPTGFSVALAGGGVTGGRVIGATDPEGKAAPSDPVSGGDLHATVLTAVGVDPRKVNQTPIGRTVRFAEGTPLPALLEK
jgi:uncharacterized protein (DUF1501 family)